MARDQLQRFRAALDNEHSSQEFEQLRTTLAASPLPITHGAQPPLKTGPPGYPATHPRSDVLRWKGVAVIQEHDKADWMHTPQALEEIREIWNAAQPLKRWLDTHVGATEEPVRSAGGRQK